jgi:hypothetical protein
MNKELIEILKSIRIWSLKTTKLCRGYPIELSLDDDCHYYCSCCPVVKSNTDTYSNLIMRVKI